MHALETVFAALWDQYATLTPQAHEIRTLLVDRGEMVVNDHVAFRTFDDPRLGIDRIAKPFLHLGYEAKDTYRFEQKKLFARYYQHPDPSLPKVFVSELLLSEFSQELQDTVRGLIDQMPDGVMGKEEGLTMGRPWSVDSETYERLAAESEYAGWMAAFGFCANHFTVFVNALKGFDKIEDLAAFIEENGYPMNRSGGLIKGSEEVALAQCSTLASQVPVAFSDGEKTVPSCYYEFAQRFEREDGTLYQGFVAASADKIFESTDRQR
ncbi:DUF1338 domain-containing protein [Parvularcula dongshanensis]|uniref:2-oxoadipate dioxygenase/decarboxylase n=1 Tax=Parvularcula dongshanensis TaxID=1173995 RepID=A0A840HZ69_9PROT|nr:DUF1338 domain-containing protein [Parvularcula dongshanensis]MBB4657727.1 hypothetical protein [Parvularcula dongshanensis]